MLEISMHRIYHLATTSLLATAYKFLCVSILCFLYQWFQIKVRKVKISVPKLILIWIFLVYLTFVFDVTGIGTLWYMISNPDYRHNFFIITALFTVSTPVTLFLNVLMTVPLGFLVPFIWRGFRSLNGIVLLGFFFSLMIETSQLVNHRSTMVDDLITNTLGAFIGGLIFFVFFGWMDKVRKRETENFTFEPIAYVVLAFLGMFLFYHPQLIARILGFF